MTPAAAGRLLKGLGEEVASVEVEGFDGPAFVRAQDLPALAAAEPPAGVRLLPAFDPYVVGATLHADLLTPGDVRDRIYRGQGWLSPVLLVEGRMEGVWRHERRGARLEVAVEPFAPLAARARTDLEREAQELAGALGGELDLTLSEP